MSNSLISYQELLQADRVDSAPAVKISAGDGTELSYRCYMPEAPKAVVLFYHNMGAHSDTGYQLLGHGLKTQFDTVVYLPDLRGHGASQGRRGDVADPNHMWSDISAMIKQIRKTHPDLPLILGGHSAGAGLVLNYTSWPQRECVDGYIFLSPQFGPLAQAGRKDLKTLPAKVDKAAFTAYMMSGGRFRANHYAVKFSYPPEIMAEIPDLVPAITINMAVALTPISPMEQFQDLDRPFGLWIGSDDELFVPEKVMALAGLVKSAKPGTQAGPIEGEKHLSILIKAHETIGPWIEGVLQVQSN